jgi:c-src tyrosine kinase
MLVYTISWLNGCFKIAGNKLHKSLTELILHHTKHLDGLRVLLQNPIPVKGNIMYDVDPDQFTQNKWTVFPGDIVRGEVLHNGEFKQVFSGEMKGEKVAVQVFKDNSSPLAFCDALVEAAIMTTLNHPNLVQLTGVHVNQRSVWMVTEFVEKGSLAEYLCLKGTLVHKSLQLKFAVDVCSGMAYLEQKDLVHKSLLAENILLTADLTAKISGFSLLRPTNFNHEVMGFVKLPIKWTAPELIMHQTPSSSSDVWSFGVLLWEIYSHGEWPYPGKTNKEAVLYVSQGGRMAPPEGCPSAMQGIMKACWAEKPDKRPTFSELVKILKTLKPSTNTLPIISQETKLLSPVPKARAKTSLPGYTEQPSAQDRPLSHAQAQRKKAVVTSPETVHIDGKIISHKIPVKLYKAPWFCGLLSRSDAESKLVPKQNGLFLIRQCTIFQEDYAICVCRVASGWGSYEHYQIKFTKEQFSIDGEREAFDSLMKLVEHYKKCPGIVVPRLLMPVNMGELLKCLVEPGDFSKHGWHIPKDEIGVNGLLSDRGLPEVWIGMHKARRVELKWLTQAHKEIMIHDFLVEAAIMTTLDHPNLVQLIGVTIDPNLVYIITEFMGKGSLLEHVRLEGSSMQRSWQIGFVRDVCSGMAYLEQKDLVHRDLTAANVLLSASKVAKVSNFENSENP